MYEELTVSAYKAMIGNLPRTTRLLKLLTAGWTLAELCEFPCVLEDGHDRSMLPMLWYRELYRQNTIKHVRFVKYDVKVPLIDVCNNKRLFSQVMPTLSLYNIRPVTLLSEDAVRYKLVGGEEVIIKPAENTHGGSGVQSLKFVESGDIRRTMADGSTRTMDVHDLSALLQDSNMLAQPRHAKMGCRALIDGRVAYGVVTLTAHSLIWKASNGSIVDNYSYGATLTGPNGSITRDGLTTRFSKSGGVDTESMRKEVQYYLDALSKHLTADEDAHGQFLMTLDCVNDRGLVLLELNAKPGLGYHQILTHPVRMDTYTLSSYHSSYVNMVSHRILLQNEEDAYDKALAYDLAVLNDYLSLKMG